MKVIIIGGGPAGMLAGIKAREEGNEVIILEKNESCGKKLLITGKGRCNITSGINISEFISNIPGNGKFLYSAFKNFTNMDIISLLKEEGLEVKEERGNRIFPVTDNARDVLNALLRRIKKLGVEVKQNSNVKQILVEESKAIGVKYNDDEKIYADKIIIATGGKSYPTTGSTGDGYKIAKELGHTIVDIKPSLVPLEVYQKDVCKRMQGLSLRNIEIKIYDDERKKLVYDDFGEMMFTAFGVTGPTIISSSAHLVKYKNINELLKNKKIKLYIDLKPALTEEKLDERILRDFNEQKNKLYKNSLDKLLPQKMIPVIIELSNINPNKQVNQITKEERNRIVKLLKEFELDISAFRPISEAIITSGGISIKEINPQTMESKIIKDLYFAGEIIDVDGYTGGFNLQIAYSTGYTARNASLRKDKNGDEKFLKIIKNNNSAEIVEKKSKFIANLIYIENEEDALDKIKEIKKKYHDARHNCFAYRILKEDIVIQRSSDDGEPSGTAGAPLLNILEKTNIVNVLVVVTRYFGGILLGTGGLVKAYSGALQEAIDNNELLEIDTGYQVEINCQYSTLRNLEYFFKINNIKIIKKEYLGNIKILIEISKEDYKKLDEEAQKNVFNNLEYKIKKESIISKKG